MKSLGRLLSFTLALGVTLAGNGGVHAEDLGISQIPSGAVFTGGQDPVLETSGTRSTADYQKAVLSDPHLSELARANAATQSSPPAPSSTGGNQAVIRQEGTSNVSSVTQEGSNNKALQTQKGRFNDLAVRQAGTDNVSVEKQVGDYNHKVKTQNGVTTEEFSGDGDELGDNGTANESSSRGGGAPF